MIFGFLLIKFDLLDSFRSFKLIGWTTIIFGILLYFSDLSKVKKTIKKLLLSCDDKLKVKKQHTEKE